MSGGSQQPTQTAATNTTQASTPQLDPRANEIFNLALPKLTNFAATVPQRYQGEQVAPFNPNQVAAQDYLTNVAAPAQSKLAGNAANTANFYTSGDIWNPSSNPNLQRSIDASVRPIYQNFTDTILPAITDNVAATGNFGSSRQGVAQGVAAGRTGLAAGDTASKLAESEYNTNVQAQLQALGLIPTVQQAQVTPGLTTGAVGDVQQQQEQARRNEAVANFNFDQYAPFLQSQELLGSGSYFPTGTSSTGYSFGQAEGNTPKASPFTQAVGGAAAGGSIGSMFGPVGTGVGAAGGAVLPFLFH